MIAAPLESETGLHPVLLVSDLHLPAQASPLRSIFLNFLQGPARVAAAVYILGDLFETWIGDEEGLVEYAAEVDALARLTQSGVKVYFQAGNRDFLVGDPFFEATGIQVLSDPYLAEFGGISTILSHGDRYCTDDVSYQRWRRFSRNRTVQMLYRWLPPGARRRIAGGARLHSDAQKKNKPDAIMDVNDAAIEQAFRALSSRLLIHGHTHRPGSQRYAGDQTRIVLPDWRPDQLFYLRCEAAANPEFGGPVLSLQPLAGP